MNDNTNGETKMCPCGHPISHHYTESETVYFSGLFNPKLAGVVEELTYLYCKGDLEPQGAPCSSLEHQWG